MFRPELIDTLKTYNRHQFTKDLMAGLIVGIVALPLAIAFAIASGVSPQQGLYTAVIAGFIISALGGSRVQIGGPTGAFIVIVYGIVQAHGINGLITAGFLAGIMLVIMGFARLGSVIKFIPHPLITGFTSGIALIIFSSQGKDFLGLRMGVVPADFLDKWSGYAANISSFNIYAVLIASASALVVFLWPRVTRKIPGSLVAIVFTTVLVRLLHLPVETIGSRFGGISLSFPKPALPNLDLPTLKQLMQPAFTIALLGGIESLLSAVVADGMTGGRHRSNTELIAQGTANICAAVFGGIPATGAIARTATNVKNGGRTPIAGIVHACSLLCMILLVGKWAALIPMATLAGILLTVAWHMSEWKNFLSVLKGPRSDMTVLLVTFFLTVLMELTIAIEIGMVLSVFLFMRKMIRFSDVKMLANGVNEDHATRTNQETSVIDLLPAGVEVFEVNGPLFFGAVYKFKDAMRTIENRPEILIIRMRQVPIIDATGIKTIEELCRECKHKGTKLILSEVHSGQVMDALRKTRLLFLVGKANVTRSFPGALTRMNQVLQEQRKSGMQS